MKPVSKTKVDLAKFPDQPRAGSNQPVSTVDNVAFLLDAAGIKPRYNEIKKQLEIEIPGHEGTDDNRDNATMTEIVSLAAKHGMPISSVPEFVGLIADRNAYNPVAQWIRSQPWDQTDRLADVVDTLEADPEYNQHLKRTLIRKWLLSATAAALMPKGFRCRGVLTLQGPQGIGKTSWLKSLINVPALRDSVIKLDHHIDGGNKDTILGAISNWIVELGELESCFRKDISRLKSFLTTDADRLRKPYARAESAYPRRTVFMATVNDRNFLIDATGNTRFWTIPVERIEFNHGIDMQQVFAQLAEEWEAGAEWWLNQHEEAALEDWNRRHRAVSATVEKILDALDLDLIGKPNNPALTPTELLEKLGFKAPISNPNAKDCGSLLRELLGPPKRIRGRDRWRIPFRDVPATINMNTRDEDEEEY